MATIRLGKTGFIIEKNGFGALPIQRVSDNEAVYLLRKAYLHSINFFDTARFYTDSEHKIGLAFCRNEEGAITDPEDPDFLDPERPVFIRDRLYIASKTGAQTADAFWKDLETSLNEMRTDHIDLYQFHNPPFCPQLDGEDGLYMAMLDAREQGLIRHIGLTNHRLKVAHECIDSGLYETLQFPFSYLAGDQEMELVRKCKEADMGFIGMKSLAGGLITNAKAAYAFDLPLDNVVPIWGVQRESELDQFLELVENPQGMTPELEEVIRKDREELCGEFCRGCGYCMPCPAGIEINNCARMSLMIRRAPVDDQLTDAMREKMMKIEDCLHCGQCKAKCPYGLDTPELLQRNLEDYKAILEGKINVRNA